MQNTIGFESQQAALTFVQTQVSINNFDTASLPLGATAVGAHTEGFAYDGKIYLTQNGLNKEGNAFDDLLLEEIWHLKAPNNAFPDAEPGRKTLSDNCKTGQR